MAALKRGARLVGQAACLSLLFSLKAQQPSNAIPAVASSELYAQATAVMLNRDFPSPRVEYLLLDLRTRQTIAVRWPHADEPVPVGSLLKPFVALAYGRLHSGAFPVVRCHGKIDGCWRAAGHGSLGLERALAESCNAYFLALARDIAASRVGMDAIDHVSESYGLPRPPEAGAAMAHTLIGVTPEWRMRPAALADAYAKLAAQADDQTVGSILAGMRLAAGSGGTAAGLGQQQERVLAKTGTAPCVADAGAERCIASGDGLVVVLAPAENPRLLLLVRQHGTTGAMTAVLAGRMLLQIERTDVRKR
jgi:cell division protein FtsI/penicillin-binding protein 2